MIFILSRDERELIARLRSFDKVGPLSEEVTRLKREIADLEINKGKTVEDHARQERELRHMIGLEKKRQEMEIAHAKREAVIETREQNLKVQQERFTEQLAFNTQRFETMEKYLKDMLSDILTRLPNVNVEMDLARGRK